MNENSKHNKTSGVGIQQSGRPPGLVGGSHPGLRGSSPFNVSCAHLLFVLSVGIALRLLKN